MPGQNIIRASGQIVQSLCSSAKVESGGVDLWSDGWEELWSILVERRLGEFLGREVTLDLFGSLEARLGQSFQIFDFGVKHDLDSINKSQPTGTFLSSAKRVSDGVRGQVPRYLLASV